jgi:hypothetical protein
MNIGSTSAVSGGQGSNELYGADRQDEQATQKSKSSQQRPNTETSAEEAAPGLRDQPASRDMLLGVNGRQEVTRAETGVRGNEIHQQSRREVNLRTGGDYISLSLDETKNTKGDSSRRATLETPLRRTEQASASPARDNTAPIDALQSRDSGKVKSEFNLFVDKRKDGNSVASSPLFGDSNTKVSALGWQTSSSAAAGFGPATGGSSKIGPLDMGDSAVRAKAAGSASIYAAKVESKFESPKSDAVQLKGAGDAQLGAEFEAAGQVEFDPSRRDLNASVEGGGFVGGRAAGEVGVTAAGGVEVSAKGDLGVGLGLEGRAKFGLDDGKMKVGVGLHGYLGLGGGGEFSFEVDIQKAAQTAENASKETFKAAYDIADKAGDAADQMVGAARQLGSAIEDAKRAWDQATPPPG